MHIAPILACPWTLPLKHNFGTNLVQTHSPGLGCTDFHIDRGILNFYLQKESKTWRLFALRISVFYLHHVAFDCISRGFQFSISICLAGTMGWWLMVTYQNLDLRNVIVHGNSSEQDLVQTHCLGRRLTLQVQSLQTSRQSKSGDVANCCQLLQTASEDHHKTYYVCACGHVHQCLHAHLLFLWHRQWWNSARCSTQILFPTLKHNFDWCWH